MLATGLLVCPWLFGSFFHPTSPGVIFFQNCVPSRESIGFFFPPVFYIQYSACLARLSFAIRWTRLKSAQLNLRFLIMNSCNIWPKFSWWRYFFLPSYVRQPSETSIAFRFASVVCASYRVDWEFYFSVSTYYLVSWRLSSLYLCAFLLPCHSYRYYFNGFNRLLTNFQLSCLFWLDNFHKLNVIKLNFN